jgi:hypothetical protein
VASLWYIDLVCDYKQKNAGAMDLRIENCEKQLGILVRILAVNHNQIQRWKYSYRDSRSRSLPRQSKVHNYLRCVGKRMPIKFREGLPECISRSWRVGSIKSE